MIGRYWLRSFTLVLFMIGGGASMAAIEAYDFEDEQSREQYQRLTEELRCPKCQNQNIADSNAPLAQDLRREVHRMVKEGQTDDQIVDFMTARYGDFVIYRPRLDSSTFLLWFGPLIMVLVGLGVILYLIRSSRRTKVAASDSAASRERLNQLLNDQEKS